MATHSGRSEQKRCLRASGVVRSLPSSITSPLSVSSRHRWLYLSPRSIPSVIDGFLLLPSSMGRSSFLWASKKRARIVVADHKVLRVGGSAFSSHLPRTPLPRTRVNKARDRSVMLLSGGRLFIYPYGLGALRLSASAS